MKESYICYLNHFLKNYFLDYPKDKVLSSYEHFDDVREILFDDILFWYPKYENKSILSEKIFDIMNLNTAIEAVFYYRLSHSIFLNDPENEFLPYISALMRMKTGAELYYSTKIGPRFMLMHGVGTVIGPSCVIGSNFLVYQGVTVGQKHNYSPDENAIIGDNVRIFSGAKILGKVTIGNNVLIGANSVVNRDIESNSVYAGIPARKIKALQH